MYTVNMLGLLLECSAYFLIRFVMDTVCLCIFSRCYWPRYYRDNAGGTEL